MTQENPRVFGYPILVVALVCAFLVACSSSDTFEQNTLWLSEGGATGGGGGGDVTPTITGISPNPALAGSTVTITGTNFDPTAASNTVAFIASTASPQTATPSGGDETTLTVTVPEDAFSGNVTVTTLAGGTSVAYTLQITPTITAVTPTTAGVSSGATILVSGTGFDWVTSSNNGVTIQSNPAVGTITVTRHVGAPNDLQYTLPTAGLAPGDPVVVITVSSAGAQSVTTNEPNLL